MSRQPSPTASGGGQGAASAPYDPNEPGYITVSLDCQIVEREKILRGALEVVLLNCGGDYYVALLEDGKIIEFRKEWDDYAIELALEPSIWNAGLCECLEWEGDGTLDKPINCLQAWCNWKVIRGAVYTIKHYQAKADALQKEGEAEKVRWLKLGSIYDLA